MTVKILPYDETYVQLYCDDKGVIQEISEGFSFYAAGYKFAPAFKKGLWDGIIRLVNSRNHTIYKGLIDVLIKFCVSRDIPIEVDTSLNRVVKVDFNVREYMVSLRLCARGVKIELRDYQIEAVGQMLSNKRIFAVSSTSSGKSLIAYSVIRYHIFKKRRILLIVPSVNLVNQMVGDFTEYSSENGWSVENNTTQLYAGKERVFDKPLIISTWQSLMSIKKGDTKLFKELVDSVDVIIGDEAHTLKATVSSGIIDCFKTSEYRYGMSGTTDGTQCNELVLSGMFGPIFKVVTAKELIDAGQAVPIDIRVMLLKHPEMFCKAYKGQDYQNEVKYLTTLDVRNNFIAKLTVATKGNTLLLFNFVQSSGKVLYEKIKALASEGRSVYFVAGEVKADERERIRKIVETETDAIILATSSLMSTGTNIPSISNLVMVMPGKSNIRIRQTIGRGLRLKEGKTRCTVFDIADNMSYKKTVNTTYRHLEERIGIYTREQFDWKIVNVDLEKLAPPVSNFFDV